jgi:hypothetical protein
MVLLLGVGGCSRQQSDWEKTRAANTTESYEQFLKRYPNGEFTAQAQARVKELYEQREWQKARDTDTQDAYQAFLKQYPEGKWSEEARIRVENFTLAQTPPNAAPAAADAASNPGNAAASGPAASAGSPGSAPARTAARPGTVGGSASASNSARPGPAPGSASANTAASPGPSAGGAPPSAAAAPGSAAGAPASAGSATSASAAPSARPPNKAGSMNAYGVQLGAFKSGADAAQRRWERLNKEYPRLLTGLSPTVVPRKTKSGTLYRLRALGLDEQRALAICKSLKVKSQPCVMLHPAHR